MKRDDRISKTPVIRVEVRVEPNYDGSYILWAITASDGTKASGFANSAPDAMHDAAAFVEAMLQPRIGGLSKKAGLRVIQERD
jgi:hypothetical protein